MIYPRSEPDGRSSIVNLNDPNGKLYCLDVGISDVKMPDGTAQRLRVIEGIAPTIDSSGLRILSGIPSQAARRILGEIAIEQDGSFNIEIPANTPIELQILDADGMALRTCAWIWAKNREPRGCIGCHEDGELTPQNNMVDAVVRPSHKLTSPPASRRTVDFRNNVMPIISKRCVGCHDKANSPVRLSSDMSVGKGGGNLSYVNLLVGAVDIGGRGRYVDPGRARTSRLIWHIFGRNVSRRWDSTFRERWAKQMPPGKSSGLTEDERRVFVEWIDLGAMWDSNLPQGNSGDIENKAKGGDK
ncbi:MAG: HzsA-related protein [Planctomycetota bacterium]